jgi:hypothetical protein
MGGLPWQDILNMATFWQFSAVTAALQDSASAEG